MRTSLRTLRVSGFAAALLAWLWLAPALAAPPPAPPDDAPLELRLPLSPSAPPRALFAQETRLRPPDPAPLHAQADPEAPQQPAPEEAARQRRKVYNGAYLLYFYQHDPADQETFFHALGLFWYRDKPDWRLYVALPLGAYWRWKDETAWGLITPLAWHVEDDDSAYTGAWLWHRWRSPESRFSTLFPIYWHHQDLVEQTDLHILGPAFWRGTPDRWTAGIAPLLWFGGGPDRAHATLFPLIGYEDDPDERSFWSPVFFHVHNKHTDAVNGGSPLLLSFWSVEDDVSSFLQSLLFYQRRTPNSTLRMVTPLAWGYENDADDFQIGGIIPFYLGLDSDDHHFRLLLPLLYARYEKEENFRFAMLGPLYHWREREEWGAGLVPLLFSYEDQDPEYAERLSLIIPLYFGFQSETVSTRVIPPLLYYRHKDGPDLDIGWVPFFFHHARPDEARSLTLVTGLYYHHERPGYLTDQWGPVVRREEPTRTRWGLLPLLQWEEDREEGTQSLFLAPGLYWSQGPQRRRWLAGPLWSFRDGETRFDGLLPLAMRYREPDGSGFIAAPGFLDIEDKGDEPGETPWRFTWLLSGFRYASRDGVSASMVAPLFVEYEDKNSGDWWALAPPWIYAAGNRALDERLIFAFPYYYNKIHGESDWWLFPLAYGHSDPERSWWLTPLALSWEEHRPGGGELLLGPLLFGRYQAGQRDCVGVPGCADGPPGADFGWLGPLVWSDTHQRRFRLLFPLVLDWADYEAQREVFTILPLYLGWQATQGDHTRRLEAWTPLYLRYKETGPHGEVLTDFGTAGPLFAYEGASGAGFGLFPLLWHDRGWDAQGHVRGHDILFPLAWRFFDEAQGTDTTVIGPVYADRDREGSAFGIAPLYFHGRAADGSAGYDALAPLLWRSFGVNALGEPWSTTLTPLGYHLREGDHTAGLWLNYYYERGEDRAVDVLFPLVWRWTEPDDDELWVLPLYWSRDRPWLTQRLLFPLYYHSEDRVLDESFTWFLPYLGHRSRESDLDALLPLYLQQVNRDGSGFRLLAPLYLDVWGEDPAEGFTALGPLWHATERGGAWSGGIFPLLWWGEEANGVDGHSVLFPLWWRFVDEQGEDLWSVLGPLWHHQHRDGWSAGLFPLAFGQRDRAQDTTRAGLFPFYYGRERDAWLATAAGLAWAWGDQDSGGAIAGPLYHVQDNDSSATGLFPLAHWSQASHGQDVQAWLLPVAYYSRDERAGRKTVIAGPAFYHRDDTWEQTWWGLFPLVWGFSQGDSGGSAVLPLYYYQGRPDGHTFLSPLGYSWRQGDDYARWALLYGAGGDARERWQTVFPLFWSRRGANGEGLDLLLPLYARWNGSDQRAGGSIFFPFYWNFYNEARQSDATVLFPLYWSFADQQRRLKIIGPWFLSERLDVERTTHGLVPIYYYSEDKAGYTFQLLGGAFGLDHDRRAQETEVQVLWIPF
jgi:hypothetical protein